ncbi:hypothetical protein DES53_103242 [Roseimicrobium gellanilyticum]|uniref:Uncharacterized protein n=1 Tax=Roseimicrobium gellanilyticum TaxID=748857 RepID=A0A366HQ54_9BACT|nr:hypothetical protein [Roseimicrobium gellanilyticum]RBP45244.1 hypothetical protein DES53_103242 [Roseimicrobium gellanilyticum]
MSFLTKLFGKKPDPTAEFPVPPKPVKLVWDTSTGSLNGIPLGAPVSALEPLGPCPDIRYISNSTTYFAYPHLGLLMEFTQCGLEFITLSISEHEFNPVGESSANAEVVIHPAGELLTPNMDPDTLTHLLGEFDLMDKDEDEVTGNFCIGDLVHEATFVEGARLVSVVIYRDE